MNPKETIQRLLENKKFVYATLFLFSFFSFIALVSRPFPIGYDSYNYLSFVFGKQQYLQGENIFVTTLFSLFPKSFFFWAAISSALLFFSSIIVAKMGDFLYPKYGLWAGLLMWIGLFTTAYLLQLEPMSFGVTLCLLATYFFVKNKNKANWKTIITIAFSSLIWEGSPLFFLAFSLIDYRLAIISIPFTIFFWNPIMAGIFPSYTVTEFTPIIGGIFVFFLFFFKFYGIGPFKEKKDWWNPKKYFDFTIHNSLKVFILFFYVLALLQLRFASLLVPFMAINTSIRLNNSMQLLTVFFIGLFVLVGTILWITSFSPTLSEVSIIKKVVSLEPNVQNDWDLGHWIAFFGGNPSQRYGTSSFLAEHHDWFSCDLRPILTRFDLNSDFKKVFSQDKYSIFVCNKGGVASLGEK
jgi:hypothetical protein